MHGSRHYSVKRDSEWLFRRRISAKNTLLSGKRFLGLHNRKQNPESPKFVDYRVLLFQITGIWRPDELVMLVGSATQYNDSVIYPKTVL